MSTEFKREERYVVFKLSDVERYLTDADRAYLAMMKNEIDAGRDCANKPPFKGLIVESDWPEYEPTWQAIEARVTGAQPAQKAVAYLDLGVGGYTDIGTDLNDEQLASLPKGRHMLGIVGTYGVDGYVSAQPAPSFADAYQGAMEDVAIWKKRALEAEDLNRKFVAEINGPAYMGESAHPAPSIPEGWKLVPIEPTEKMINEGTCAATLPGPRYIDSACAKHCWEYMLAAAPEAKP